MSFIRKNKFVIIAIGVFLILVVLGFQIATMFFPEEGTALYGDRLDGIEEVELSNSKLTKIESNLKSDGAVKEADVSVAGKIVEVIITVQDDTSVDTAKALNTKVLDSLSNKEKKFYDIQIFVKKDSEATDFPIIGYKHHAKDTFSWTKDRGAE
jgi:ABC-type Na+ efflux pump permease subunit